MRWQLRGKVRGALIGALLVLLVGCGGGVRLPQPDLATPAATAVRYVDPQGRFSFARPAAWQPVTPTPKGSLIAFSSPTLGGILGVSAEPVAATMTIDRYVQATLQSEAAAIPGFAPQSLARNPTASSGLGEASRTIDFLSQGTQGSHYSVQTIIFHAGTAYLFERNILADHAAPADPFIVEAQHVFDTLSFP